MSSSPDISVVVPTLNEVQNIVPICRAVLMALKEIDAEVIVVDDDSEDGTAEAVRQYAERDARVKIHVRKNERCLTTAIAKGVELSRGRWIARIDSDFILRAKELVRMVQAVERGADFSFASRYVPGGKDYRKEWDRIVLSYLINKLCQIVLIPRYKDYTSCLFVCRREVLEEVPLRGDYGEFFLPLLTDVHRRGFKIEEVPYVCRSRRKGQTKTSPSLASLWKRGRQYLTMALHVAQEI